MKVEVGSIYHHFKGMEVKVLMMGYDSETLEEMVIYEELADHKVWVRPLKMFLSKVDKNKYPDIKQEHRFELVG